MPMRFASVCLLASILMALLFGAQTLSWSWGPSLLCLGVGLAAALFIEPAFRFSKILTASLLGAALWIGWRAWHSPVAEDARADALLVLAVLAMAAAASRLDPKHPGFSWFTSGLSLLVIVNGAFAFAQWFEPSLSWPYPERPMKSPSGFFGHYNYFSNFMLGAGLFVAPRVVLSRDRLWQKILHGGAIGVTVCMIPLSGSRGGLLGLGVGLIVLFLAISLVAWRRKKRGLLIGMCIAPVLCLLALLGSWKLLRGTGSDQMTAADVAQNLDNDARLVWYKVAMAVISDHPLKGGGSRAYSWKRNQHWEPLAMGLPKENESFVHNEALQLASDYGMIGVVLVGGVLLTVACLLVVSLALGSEQEEEAAGWEAVAAGVLPGMVGMLIQSNFSFVFHLLPSVLLLGIWLGFGGRILGKSARVPAKAASAWSSKLLLGIPAIILMVAGTSATGALLALWPIVGRHPSLLQTQPAEGWKALGRASHWWPGWSMEQLRANTARAFADRADLPDEQRWEWYETAVAAYDDAVERHPHNASLSVNRANTLSILRRDGEAELEFERALKLQGNLERVFDARLFYARHLYDAATREWGQRRPEAALARLLAAEEFLTEQAVLSPAWSQPRESKSLVENIAKVKAFLENANIQPSGWERPRVKAGEP